MSPRPRKPFSKSLDVLGVAVRIYERTAGGVLYLSAMDGHGKESRKSLGHRDRALAEDQARAVAQRLSELRLAGTTAHLTLGQLVALYTEHALPVLSAPRQKTVASMCALLQRHFGRDFRVEELSQHHVDAYTKARRSGAVKHARHRTPEPGVRAGTIRNELAVLAAMLRWARGHRVHGRPLFTANPLEGVKPPREVNVRRPVATDDRFRATLAQAAAVDPQGRFRCALLLARHTGRRVRAILSLRASDVLRTQAAMERALGATGQPLTNAAEWPHGAIYWAGRNDKREYDAVAPLNREARAALDAYLRDHPRVGDVPLFPATGDPSKAAHPTLAGYWLRRAETLAELPKLERGAWHTFRRMWASERRSLPVQDVMAAGGWRSAEVLRTAYQHADAATVFAVTAAQRPTRRRT
jgi:integrase